MIINCICGPRNISTALMYSFAQHPDIKVVDEPFYSHYLIHTGIDHPGRSKIIQSMPSDQIQILKNIETLHAEFPVIFLKNMAHHHQGLDWSYLFSMKNLFLIRDPKELILSFSKVIPNPSLQDIGLKEEAELLDYILENSHSTVSVLNTNDILENPAKVLTALCEHLQLAFSKEMLSWQAGPLPEDGVWAKYWYRNVHASTGFRKRTKSADILPAHLKDLYEESLPYYERLKKHQLTIN